MEYQYRCLWVRQTKSEKALALFAAPVTQVNRWAGVPQKKKFDSASNESVGFQREENSGRVKSLGDFCENDENIIQNPLLCATRKLPIAALRFVPDGDQHSADCKQGVLIIDVPDYQSMDLLDIFGYVRAYIESRVSELKGKAVDSLLVARLKQRAATEGHADVAELSTEDEGGGEDSGEESGATDGAAEAEAVLFEESHIADFWAEIAGRHEVLKLIEQRPNDEFLGFSRDALLSYLKPVVLVDGQHRLSGAIESVERRFNDEAIRNEIESRIQAGDGADLIAAEIRDRESRRLPISLLLADDAAEQVFQFVVVNQKATPIGRALLGTIVSTTLSNEEMEGVASRLQAAGIELEESKAVTYLARSAESPFFGLIERGLTGDEKDLLKWNVFASLINIFKDLKGGKLFGYKNDYAEIWRNKYLPNSALVAGQENCTEYWRSLDGPWRKVFIAFYTKIRDEFGDVEVADAHNYWGKPRASNLFNKISLTILAADFFQFLVESRVTIDSVEDVSKYVDEWLIGVSRGYFSRDWKLVGVKKDSSGIRSQWAYQWLEYRKDPTRLPNVPLYRTARS